MMRRILLALALVAALPAAALAESFATYGPHFGFSTSPDQFVVGGQLQWGDIAPSLDFVPSLDLGFGDNETIISINGDFHYRLDTGTKWQPYLGGGVGVHFVSIDNAGPGIDDSRTDSGGHFIGRPTWRPRAAAVSSWKAVSASRTRPASRRSQAGNSEPSKATSFCNATPREGASHPVSS
jgi:hypothetical protein